jgi:nitrite reductase/ring-hydroxylating ferredoxin subunit
MKPLFILLLAISLLGCSGSQTQNENCRFLLDINVYERVDLNLPSNSELQFAGNSVYIPAVGNGGIIVANTGADFYAWDATDPNHIPSSCSVLSNSGLNATCGCDDKNEYSLVTGQALNDPTLICSLRNYRVEVNGNILIVSN